MTTESHRGAFSGLVKEIRIGRHANVGESKTRLDHRDLAGGGDYRRLVVTQLDEARG